MKWIDGLARRLGYTRARGRRSFAAAAVDRLTAGWVQESEHINRTLRYDLRALRARSRDLAKNNVFAARFFQMVVQNICGPRPFVLQAKVRLGDGRPNTRLNARIEDAWAAWGRACDVSGRLCWDDFQRAVIRAVARDGEALVIAVPSAANTEQFALQLIDADRIDVDYNEELSDGRVINCGVELDATWRPIAYHLLRHRPRDDMMGVTRRERIRVDARQCRHVYLMDNPEQVRGIPWMHASMMQLRNLGGFEEAAVIAARVGAAKMGFYTSPDGAVHQLADQQDANGRFLQDAEPGHFDTLPAGYRLESWNPQFPDAAVEPFVKACLRGVAAGLGVAYHSLAMDLEGVNFSSSRAGVLDERDWWMSLQNWFSGQFHDWVYDQWLEFAAMRGLLGDVSIERIRARAWQGRRWSWVDPLKDTQAQVEAINAGLKSRTQVVTEMGRDLEDVFDELALEQALAEEKGLALGAQAAPAQDEPAGEAEADDAEDNDDDEQRAKPAIERAA